MTAMNTPRAVWYGSQGPQHGRSGRVREDTRRRPARRPHNTTVARLPTTTKSFAGWKHAGEGEGNPFSLGSDGSLAVPVFHDETLNLPDLNSIPPVTATTTERGAKLGGGAFFEAFAGVLSNRSAAMRMGFLIVGRVRKVLDDPQCK